MSRRKGIVVLEVEYDDNDAPDIAPVPNWRWQQIAVRSFSGDLNVKVRILGGSDTIWGNEMRWLNAPTVELLNGGQG